MTINEICIQMSCPSCKANVEYPIQFCYGYLRLLKYHIGEKIRWDSPDVGRPGLKRVVVKGWAGWCPSCHSDESDEDYYIFIEDDVIKSLEKADGRYLFNDDDFRIIEEESPA